MSTLDDRLTAFVAACKAKFAALSAQIAAAVIFTDNSVSWPPNGVRTLVNPHSWTFGDERIGPTTTIFPSGFEFDLQTGAFGAMQPGGCYFNVILNAHNRVPFGVFGTVLGWEFNATPYVGTNAIFHAGANKMAAQADSTAPDVATLKADFNALLAKARAAGLMA